MKRIHAIGLVCCGIIVGFLGGISLPSAHGDATKIDYEQVVGKIGDTTVTRGQIAEDVMAINDIGMKQLTGEYQDRALVQEAARRSGVTVSADEIAQRVQDTIDFATTSAQKAQLTQDKAALAENLRNVLLVEKMTKLSVTEEDGKDFYRAHPQLFIQPDLAQMIVIDTSNKAQATAALKRLQGGDDIKRLAELYSTNEPVKEKRSLARWWKRGEMNPQIQQAIFGANNGAGLKPGGFTDVITVEVPHTLTDEEAKNPDAAPSCDYKYLIMYVQDIKHAVAQPYDQVKSLVLYYARAAKYGDVAGPWFADQAKTIGKEWMQVADLKDPLSPLAAKPIDPRKYGAATDTP